MQSPLGPYGQAVAAILAIVIVVAAIATHIIPGMTADAWLDSTALVVAGVVFGAQVVQNGTQTRATSALDLAKSIETRMNVLENVGRPAQRATDRVPSTPPDAPA